MKSNFEKYQIFVYLLLIIFGMLALRIKYGYKATDSELSKPSSIQIPTLAPSATVTPTINELKDYPLKNYLPHKGKGFVIDKYVAPMTLQMTLNTASEAGAVSEATKWLESFDGEMGQHTIEIIEATPTPTRAPIKIITAAPSQVSPQQ